MQLDDRQFIQMINDTGVILNRDHTKWNYDLVVELLEGALMNPKRLDEAIKATKFVRRLMSFFHPSGGRFPSINRTGVSSLVAAFCRCGVLMGLA
jgi:rapamycin-insensitive companion of mTOR